MPHHNPSVQPEDAPKIIFVRQQFSAFGGAELILDRTLEALGARGHKVALLGRSWREDRSNVGFIRCDPPKVTRSLREMMFARAACRVLKRYPHSLVQAHERIPCCDIFRAGDGVHAAYSCTAQTWRIHGRETRVGAQSFSSQHLAARAQDVHEFAAESRDRQFGDGG